MNVSADVIVQVLQQRAVDDRLVAEMLRAAVFEAALLERDKEKEPPAEDDTDE